MPLQNLVYNYTKNIHSLYDQISLRIVHFNVVAQIKNSKERCFVHCAVIAMNACVYILPRVELEFSMKSNKYSFIFFPRKTSLDSLGCMTGSQKELARFQLVMGKLAHMWHFIPVANR